MRPRNPIEIMNLLTQLIQEKQNYIKNRQDFMALVVSGQIDLIKWIFQLDRYSDDPFIQSKKEVSEDGTESSDK